tara:strand:- start:701 stop:883 length:183 start_codon:yes stop_codon:yes gene_type:complete
MEERRSGKQRRSPLRFLKIGDKNKSIGRRLEDFEFSLFIKMGIITFVLLAICIIAVMYIK